MILTNANIFTRDCTFKLGSLEIEDGRITRLIFDNVPNSDYDCQGAYLIPGLIDIHSHGANGHDYCDANEEAFNAITSYELAHGITSICATTMTYPKDKLEAVMKAMKDYKNENGSEIVGINMEGPFISKDKVGAQNPDFVQNPDIEMLDELNEASRDMIKLVDVAPEVDGGIDFIKKASKNYVVSVAHTNCDYEKATEAFKNGAKHLTHTFNAMPPIHHRSPGPIVAAAENGASAEIICDGQHVNYAAVRLAFKLFDNNICLISDSCEATGLSDGQYSIGGQDIIKKGTKVVLKDSPDTIAASVTNLFDCLKHAILDANIPKEVAIASATINSAKAIGIDMLYGSLEPGKFADMLLLNDNFEIIDIFKRGLKVKK